MMTFAWLSVGSMIVALIVWSRSEVILLKHFCSDIRQIAFYSLSFTMAEQLLIGSYIFSAGVGTTIFAQFGRDRSRLPEIAGYSFRYLALTAIPLHFISAALAVPALRLLYGHQYEGAAMVATLAPLLCMTKAFLSPVQSLLESMERQKYVILATALAGIVDIGVAWSLIRYLNPAHGAVGACIGNGSAQAMAVGMLWMIGIHLYKVKLPWRQVLKVVFISVLASLTAHYTAMRFSPLWGILVGGSAALIVLFGLFYLLRVLEPQDRARFNMLSGMLPNVIAGPVNYALLLLISEEVENAFSPNE
jgi:O-antigen/teichoic acid export membrane protein